MIKELDEPAQTVFKKGNIPIGFRFVETFILWVIGLA